MKKTAQPTGATATNLRPLPIQDRPDKVYHDPEKKPNKLVRWYQKWQENARRRFDQNYYPRHERTPNFIVRLLYEFGFFIGDFVPLTLNLIDGIYRTLKRLLAFIVGLLIEASTVVVLIGTIIFSVAHSIELLRRAGATGGFEYVGVLMFEIVFISSTAILTGMLMNWNPKVFRTAGFWFCSTAFMVGVGFVLWSNISAMAPTWEGKAIGILTPLLLIISEGLLAFRNVETGKDTGHLPYNLVQWMRENQVSYEEIMLAVEAFRKEQTEGSDTQNVSGSREEKLEESPLENLETSHPASSHLETGGMEKSPTEKLETSRLENLESGELENPPAKNLEGGDLEEVKLETSKLEAGESSNLEKLEEEKLETPKLETSRLEEKKLENQESLETGELETSRQKLTESITSWKLENLPPRVENRAKPTSLKVSTLEGEKLEDQKLEDQKLEAGELEKPESGDLENLETSKLEESATGEMETSSLEDLEVETGEQIGELEEKLETPKLEAGESSSVENLETGESSNLENQKQEKFTKEDLEHFSREELEAMKGADPEDVAVRILEREGELPGRPRLKRLTGCTEWDARKTLRELKKELNAS